MKKIVLFVFLVFVSTSSFSQIETNYLYGSTDSYNWIFPQDENAPIIRLDSFDPKNSRWDRYLGMTAPMTQVPTANPHG